MNRRFLLESLCSTATYAEWYAQFVYHTLVPQTVSSSTIANSGRAKLVKIEGNGVVENQKVEHGEFTTDHTTNWIFYTTNGTFTTDSNGTHYTCTTAGNILQVMRNQNDAIGIPENHKCLLLVDMKSNITNCGLRTYYLFNENAYAETSKTTVANAWQTLYLFGTKDGRFDFFAYLYFAGSYSVDDTVSIRNLQLIDLTLMFGTGNEPTTLTDTRVQALLNRGYIAYNTGAIKDTNVSKIEFEPYNLFDEVLELGYLNVSGGYVSSNTDILSKNFQTVIPNKTYNVNADNFTHTLCFICEYDENQTYIANTRRNITSSHSFTASSQTRYVKFWFYSGGTTYSEVPTNTQVYLALQGTRTGYAPHKSPSTISLPNTLQLSGAINSHDTFEITNSGYVFTRNVWKYTFNGSESFSIGGAITSGLYRYYTNVVNTLMNSGSGQDGLCDKYAVDKGSYNAATTPCVRFGQSNSAIYFYLTQDYSQSSDVASAVNGTTIYYPLASPQTITIPKAHLGCVDLGSLDWTYYSGTGVFWATVSDIKVQTPNLICSKYLTQGYISSSANLNNGYIGTNMWTGNGNQIIVKDTSFTSATDFKNAMSGVYLFYETISPVINTNIAANMEVGGSVTTAEFEYIENQLVQNGNFVDTTKWSKYNLSDTTWSVSDNTATIVVNSMTSSYGQLYQNITIVNNHKYLLKVDVKTSANESIDWRLGQGSATTISATTSWQTFTQISSRTDSGRDFGLYLKNTITTPLTVYLKNVMYFDLTLAFGSGNEPTSTSDPRIQYIINQGYIPTDTTGTDTLVDSQVLPNIEFGVKAK